MVGMPEIYVLDVGMCDKMLVLVCWNLCNFYASVQQNNIYIYILEKVLRNILLLRKNAGKSFTENCNNPGYTISKTIIAFLEGKNFSRYFRRRVIFYFKCFICQCL